MKKLNELFDCNYDILIESIEEDSRVIKNNYLFFCIIGVTTDGHKYVDQAIENGAVAIVASKKIEASVPVIMVDDTSKAIIHTLSKFYNNVDKKIKLIGITGTDGKTSSSTMIYQIINYIEKTCGLIGSNGIKSTNFNKELNLTTPIAIEYFNAFFTFYNSGCKYVVMEVASEALLGKRVCELEYDIAIFTNLTPEHLNNHKTMENYRDNKLKLFKMVKKDGISIINNDDDYSDYFKSNANGKIITYGIDNTSDVMAKNIIIAEKKLLFDIKGYFGDVKIECPLSGKFNVYNLLTAIITTHYLGFDINLIKEAIRYLEPIEGRMISIDYCQPFKVIVDYAHTANGLKNLLEFMKVITKGKIITLTGSAGGRDKEKRPAMGRVVCSLSDYVIFTSDDLRWEDPNDIIDDMVSEIKNTYYNYTRVIDRPNAIRKALTMANKDDTVVVAGRGVDSYQPIGDKMIYCNDIEEVMKYFEGIDIKC